MSAAIFHVLTLFPEMVAAGLRPSVIGRAWERDVISLDLVNIRDYTTDRHGKVDDYPYGGGAGMLMQAQPVYDAYRAVTGGRFVRTIYVTPQGSPFTQQKARELASERELIFLCGHYEGIDERVLEEIVTDSVSIGDYVLTGGELPAMVMIDAIARLIPGVLGNDGSAAEESFWKDLLEYPQYSRPVEWHGRKVPEILLSGDHRKVRKWRLEQSLKRTAKGRPDLYEKYQEKQLLVRLLSGQKRNHIHLMEFLNRGSGEILYSNVPGRNAFENEISGNGSWEEKGFPISVLLYDSGVKTAMAIAADTLSCGQMAERLPKECRTILVSQTCLRDLLLGEEYRVVGEYSQVLYTRKEVLRVKHKEIRSLTMEDYPCVCRWCHGDKGGGSGFSDEDVKERILSGAMYGVFLEGRQTGFLGIRPEGSLGMLYVEPSFRRQGIAASLEAYAVNRMLEKGWTPYGYVEAGNLAAERLQERLGFYKSEKTFWRLEKILAK